MPLASSPAGGEKETELAFSTAPGAPILPYWVVSQLCVAFPALMPTESGAEINGWPFAIQEHHVPEGRAG
jgi:hypothetical protein